jgi:hypothetical protein
MEHISPNGMLSASDIHRIGIEYVYDHLIKRGFKGIQTDLSKGNNPQLEAHKGNDKVFIYVRTEMFPHAGGFDNEDEFEKTLKDLKKNDALGYFASVGLTRKGVYSHIHMGMPHERSEFLVSFVGLQQIDQKNHPTALSRVDVRNTDRDPYYEKFSKFRGEAGDVLLLTKTDLSKLDNVFEPEELGRVQILHTPDGPVGITIPHTHAGEEKISVIPWEGVQYVDVNPSVCSYDPFEYLVKIHINCSTGTYVSGLANQQMVDFLSATTITFPFDSDVNVGLVLLTKGVPTIRESTFHNRTKSLSDKNACQIARWVSLSLRELKSGIFKKVQEDMFVMDLKIKFKIENPDFPNYALEYVFSKQGLRALGFNPLMKSGKLLSM